MLYYFAWLLLQPWKLFLRVKGAENIPKKRCKMIVIASHNGELDPWRIGIYLPFVSVVHWFAKKEFFTVREARNEFNWFLAPFVAFIVRYSSTIAVDKNNEAAPINRSAIRDAMRILKKERILGIFPRAKIGEKEYVNPNFIGLAMKKHALVLPVNVQGRRIVFGKTFRIEVCQKEECLDRAQEIMKKIEDM